MLKGKSSSGRVSKPDFPLEISDELLTRVDESVKINSEGSPVYITDEKSLAERFGQLLQKIGDIDYRMYSRDSRFELRYPKFLHNLFLNLDFEESLPALVDESGIIQGRKILIRDQEIPVEEFNQKVFSREKQFEIALETGKTEKITKIVHNEQRKVENLFKDLKNV